jgi:hypothetical protein
MNEAEKREGLYKRWCHLFLTTMISAAQVAKTLSEVREEWHQPPFVPEGLDFLDIDDPLSPINSLIRRAIAVGIISESDKYLQSGPVDSAPQYKMNQV